MNQGDLVVWIWYILSLYTRNLECLSLWKFCILSRRTNKTWSSKVVGKIDFLFYVYRSWRLTVLLQCKFFHIVPTT
jgi:hypothetical protein